MRNIREEQIREEIARSERVIRINTNRNNELIREINKIKNNVFSSTPQQDLNRMNKLYAEVEKRNNKKEEVRNNIKALERELRSL